MRFRQEAGGTARPCPSRGGRSSAPHATCTSNGPEWSSDHAARPASCALRGAGSLREQQCSGVASQAGDVWNESPAACSVALPASTPAACICLPIHPSVPPTAVPGVLSRLRRLLGRCPDWRSDVLAGPRVPGRGGTRSAQGRHPQCHLLEFNPES